MCHMVQCVLVWCSVEPGESYVRTTHMLYVVRRSVMGTCDLRHMYT